MLALLLLLVVSPFVGASLLPLAQPNDVLLVAALSPLVPRQQGSVPNVPAPCKQDCDPINTQVQQGCPPSKCCVSSFVNGYSNCLKCVGTTLGIPDFTPAQATLDNLVEQCVLRGFDVPRPTLPGVDPSGPLSGVASSTRTSARSTSLPASLPLATFSLTSTTPPNLPPPLPPSATSQITITSIDPLNTPAPQGATPTSTPTSTSTSGTITHRLSTPQFSHLTILSIVFVVFARFMV